MANFLVLIFCAIAGFACFAVAAFIWLGLPGALVVAGLACFSFARVVLQGIRNG